jgi:integrase
MELAPSSLIKETDIAAGLKRYFVARRLLGIKTKDVRTLTKKAGRHGLRFHDLRHTAISALGEAGVPDRVIMDIVGQVSARMLRRYSHIQLEAERAAIQALSNRPQTTVTGEADVTKHVTKHPEGVTVPSQVIEKW